MRETLSKTANSNDKPQIPVDKDCDMRDVKVY